VCQYIILAHYFTAFRKRAKLHTDPMSAHFCILWR